jgi:hypothetical protein
MVPPQNSKAQPHENLAAPQVAEGVRLDSLP